MRKLITLLLLALALPAGAQIMFVKRGAIASVSGGSLSVTVTSPSTSDVNLTSLGGADWALWGTGVTAIATPTQRKSGGGSLITAAAYGPVYSIYDCPGYCGDNRLFTWTNGTPTASSTDDQALQIGDQDFPLVGEGYDITVPASASSRTLILYCSGQGGSFQITASLSDSSASPVSATASGAAATITPYYVTIVFNAASSSQTLTVRTTVQTRHQDYYANPMLQAAWLSN